MIARGCRGTVCRLVDRVPEKAEHLGAIHLEVLDLLEFEVEIPSRI